ncbi:MAG TPA: hypothetical protein VLN59_13745 [Burkholderiales bacterium]|nr:hypothetical protein [Burkholderiales bacterium]
MRLRKKCTLFAILTAPIEAASARTKHGAASNAADNASTGTLAGPFQSGGTACRFLAENQICMPGMPVRLHLACPRELACLLHGACPAARAMKASSNEQHDTRPRWRVSAKRQIAAQHHID